MTAPVVNLWDSADAVETQLGWLRQPGLIDVDCHWRWRELALFAGSRPA